MNIINWLRLLWNYRKSNPEDLVIVNKNRVRYNHDNLITYNEPVFLQNEKFIKSYESGILTAKGTALLPNDYQIYWRIHVLCFYANLSKHLKGDFIDFGVNTGIFSLSVMNYLNFNSLNKTYFLLDTFDGLDEKYSSTVEMEKSKKQMYNSDGLLYQKVINSHKGFNVKIIKGAVPDTLNEIDSDSFCFVSIDMNSAIPEYKALKYIWPKLVKGGVIILDDYAFPGYDSLREAHDRFAKEVNVEILCLPTCQGVIVKPYE